ncbi:GbsR/MarR family transcriptional regulator [Phaeocystidibacter luteus]|uniref:HTH-type transcriptional regulator n=1 Tax=Phaeocystidibacter luteus TaxID=911197 RepID=A0A6N6RHI4_9FLAO|nr:MarR family transcriptional regulator [Phaeocystidibacter luteus]KAB2809930.1 transcriptional regulator [Phaeocystidibacter luteus]
MEYQQAKERFIQTWGTLGAQWGINRTMAQVHALLLISPKSLTTDDVMEELGVSRGNANMNLRGLVDWGLVYRDMQKGDRKDYFRAEKDLWVVAKRIADERKKRELDTVKDQLTILKQVEGNSPEVEEFKKVIKDIDNVTSQALQVLGMMTSAADNFLMKTIRKLKG